jgi:hypothetical protein
VAGFDPDILRRPKSCSVARALADGLTRERINAAHGRALELVIGYAEREALSTARGAPWPSWS